MVLDSGATASVWKAYDRKLGRHVAIKVFHGGAASTIRQGLAEARASSEVISEHVVRVHDVHDADPPYIVLELVGEHEPGSASLEPGPRPATCRPRDIGEAVRWVRDVARGVHDAHLHDVFHRDLKPHNVLITPVSRRAKIADFGLAISAASARRTSASPGLVVGGPSGPARIAGTPESMAPEQARGLPRSRSTRATRRPANPGRGRCLGPRCGRIRSALGHAAVARARPGSTAWGVAASGRVPARLEHTKAGEAIPARLRKIVERALASSPAIDMPARVMSPTSSTPISGTGRRRSIAPRPAKLGSGSGAILHLTVTAAVAIVCATMSLAAYATVVRLRNVVASSRRRFATSRATGKRSRSKRETSAASSTRRRRTCGPKHGRSRPSGERWLTLRSNIRRSLLPRTASSRRPTRRHVNWPIN